MSASRFVHLHDDRYEGWYVGRMVVLMVVPLLVCGMWLVRRLVWRIRMWVQMLTPIYMIHTKLTMNFECQKR